MGKGKSSVTKCPLKDKTLIKLTVSGGGVKQIKGTWFTSVAATQDVEVTAITRPNDSETWDKLVWINGAPEQGGPKNVVKPPRAPARDPFEISATLKKKKSVKLCFVELTSLVCENGEKLNETSWKFYQANGKFAEILATPSYDKRSYRNEFTWTWNTGTPGKSNRRHRIRLDTVGDVTVRATLFDHPKEITVKVCQVPAELRVSQLTFTGGHTVACDARGDFDNKWLPGRAAPRTPVNAPATVQSPLCYTRNTRIHIRAEFEVMKKPSSQEQVTIRGTANFSGTTLRWEQANVTVGPAASSVTIDKDSDVSLPDVVAYYPNLAIVWEVIGADGLIRPAGQTTHDIYVTLGNPAATVFWTLLDISCQAAKGKSSPNDFVAESFKPFAAAKGSGNGFTRKTDGIKMSYYNKGSSTAATQEVYTTVGMLGSPEGTGRCGGWATLLRHMWQMHGVASTQRWYIRATDKTLLNFDLRFLVKNCKFSAVGTRANSAYTHEGAIAKKEVEKEDGIPGHGQDNPQFDFGDHVVVKYGGKLYDPSYGVGPYDTDDLYLNAALCGLGKWPKIGFQFKSMDQHMPTECTPYGEGFAEYTITYPFEKLAQEYGVSGTILMASCVFFNQAQTAQLYPANPRQVTTGMWVGVITRLGYEWSQMGPTMTLRDIAVNHRMTEDQIFDDVKNASIKALRTNKANLETGDTIVVSKVLDPACWLVVGHDL